MSEQINQPSQPTQQQSTPQPTQQSPAPTPERVVIVSDVINVRNASQESGTTTKADKPQ